MKRHIVIVGGGSAGWITLAYLAATTQDDITIIHSDEIDIIGVGESTTPTIKHVADTVGVDLGTWMKSCRGTFKYGVDLHDFHRKGSRWLHTFDDMIPHQCFNTLLTENGKTLHPRNLSSIEYYLTRYGNDPSRFNSTHGPMSYLTQRRLSPFDRQQQHTLNSTPGHAFHINAFQFGNSLRDQTPRERYREIIRRVVEVTRGPQGIDHLVLEGGETVSGDVFIDCTGFRRLLMQGMSKWKSYSELINNAAVWGQVRGVTSDNPVTGVWAQDAGWIWEIPTWQQIGSGYVHSRNFVSEDQAVDTISRFWQARGHKWDHLKSITFDAGRWEDISIKNVVTNGLAQSFIEPLEATSVAITCSTVRVLSDILNRNPDCKWDDRMARLMSRTVTKFIDHNRNFIYHHYRLSQRDDTEYWRQVANHTGAAQEVSDYADSLASIPWVGSGETVYNQWNWISMLLHFDRSYANCLPKIDAVALERYEFYSQQLINNYEFMLQHNMPIREFLELIHAS